MKRIILAFTVICIPILLSAQNSDGSYNPFVNAGTISPSPIHPVEANGAGEISFNFGNTGSDPLEYYPDQHVALTITLSYGEPDNIDPLAAIGGTASGLFTWSYSSGTFTAQQNTQIPANYSGTLTIAYRVTQNSAPTGMNGFNVNITPAAYQTGSNSPDDDQVSSYTYTEIRDYSDAPSSYGIADHIIDFIRFLGTEVDGEDSALTSVNADGDDSNGIDDEDGVVFPAEIFRGQTLNLPVTNTGMGYLNGWIDWNGDGDFLDAGEQVATDLQRFSGTSDMVFTVPSDAIITGPTFARLRFSENEAIGPTGSAVGGEVEDYLINIACNPPAVTLAASEVSFCENTPVTFTAGGGDFFEFRVDGVTAQTGASSTYLTDSLTDGQTVNVIVSDAFSCSAISDGISVTVFPLPDPTLTSSDADNSFCAGEEITFTAGGGINYNFRIDDASVQSGSASQYITASISDGQTLDVIVTNGDGCQSISPGITNSVIPTPDAPLVLVADNCDGTSTLTTSSTGTLLWSTGETTPAIIVSNAGTYTVTTTVNGCISEAGSGIASPTTAPDPPGVSNNSPENLCPDLTVNLESLITSSTPAGGTILYKTVNDPEGADIANPNAASAGTYYLFYQDANGCYSSGAQVNVTINDCPPDVTPTLQVNPNIMHGITTFNLVVRITELNNVDTDGIITVTIPKDPRWILADGFVTSLTELGGAQLNNSAWSYSEGAVNHIFTTSTIINAGGYLNFGFSVTFDPGSTRGLYTITSQVESGSGGEIRVSNNVDSEKIDYFQQ